MPSLKDYISEALKKGYKREEIIGILQKKGYTNKEIEQFLYKPKEKDNFRGEDYSFVDRIKLIFSEPVGFFQKIRENSIKNSFLLFLSVGFIITLLNIGLALLFSSIFYGVGFGLPLVSGFFSFGFTIAFFILSVVAIFAYAGIVHLIVIMLKGKGSFTDTFNALAYSAVPSELLSIIPFVGFLAFIYAIVLGIFGISEYHKISKGKAALAVLTPIIIMFILVVIFIIYLFISLSRAF